MRTEKEESSIADFLGSDHREIDKLWNEFIEGVKRGDNAQEASRLERFASRLRRHIRMEEENFFPAFEERTGMRDAGPTAVMRSEHRQIEAMLDRLTRATADPDRVAAAKALATETAQLFAFLQNHDRKEEGVLYPMADRVVPDADRRRLIEKMRAL